MKFPISRTGRPGMTLVELLLFVGIIGVSVGVIFPIVFSSVEQRLLQQTIAVVEQNGAQLLQAVGQRVRHAERVLDPAASQTGAVLALQTGSGSETPTIIGIQSGSLVLIRYLTQRTLSSPEVAISNFVARNTSVSAGRPSVQVGFDATRTIRLHAPRTYTQHFEAVFTLLPDDRLLKQSCACQAPTCQTTDSYLWQVCSNATCDTATVQLTCP